MYSNDQVLRDLNLIQATLHYGGYYQTDILLWEMIGAARKKVDDDIQ